MMSQQEAVDEVDGAPLRRMVDISRMTNTEFMRKEQHDSGFGSLSSNPSGFGSLASNASLTDNFNRLKLAENAFHNGIQESCEEGYVSMLQSESIPEICEKPPTQTQEPTRLEILNLFTPDNDGDTQLHLAIIKGFCTVAKRIIDLAPSIEDVNRAGALKLTPLHMAVLTDQPLLVRHLLCAGATVELRDEHGNTPLHLACDRGYLMCVEALTQPLTANEVGRMPFQRIPQDMDIKNYDGNTCMHLAAQQSRLEVLAYLYGPAVGADVNARDGLSGRTVLHHAADMGNSELVAFLMTQRGVCVDAKAYNKYTPLQLAEGRGHIKIMQTLMTAGARLQTTESSSESDTSSEDDMMDSFDDIHINGRTMCT